MDFPTKKIKQKMSKPLQKSLQDYLSKMKKRKTYSHKFRVPSRILSSSSKKKILRACNRPRTRSIVVDESAATLADVDRFLFENFKSLYLKDGEEDERKNKGLENGGCLPSPDEEKRGAILLESPRFIDLPPDVCASHRFFVSPASSGSLFSKSSATPSEDTGSSSTPTAASKTGVSDVITVLKYSPTPYDDFRRSMEEVIEARMNHRGMVDWEFMVELLFCYLDLNEKKYYKYVLGAFVDLIVVLRANSGKVPAKSRRGQTVGDRRK